MKQLQKVVFQIWATDHDDDGDIVNELVIAEGKVFPKQLPEIQSQIEGVLAEVNAQDAEAAAAPTPNRAARRAKTKPKAKPKPAV